MNPRIRELYDQCFVALEDQSPNTGFDFEKFAGLIVQECLDIISPYAVRMENFDGGHPIADLKKHFGVE